MMFKDFKPELKLFFIVALVAVALTIGEVFLLKTTQSSLAPTSTADETAKLI